VMRITGTSVVIEPLELSKPESDAL
jgi:hypothetical protein